MSNYTEPALSVNNKETPNKSPQLKTSKEEAANISPEIASTKEETSQSVEEAISLNEQSESNTEKLKKYTILHLDDEIPFEKMFNRMLINRDPKVKAYQYFNKLENLLKALEISENPTIIICDNDFGGPMFGLDVAEKTLQLRQEKNIPFILFSSGPKERQEKQFNKLIENGTITAFMQKPSAPSEMIATLESVVN